MYTEYRTYESIIVQAVDSGSVPYQFANLHIALVRVFLLADDTETLGLACIRPRGMWQKTIFVCQCGLIFPTSLLSVLVSDNSFEGEIRDNYRLVASHA